MIRIILLIFLLFSFFTGYSQPTKGDANGNFENGNYDIALQQYLRLLKHDKENVDFHYKIGLCYLRTDLDKSAAIPYLEFAQKDPKIDKSIMFDIGLAYYHSFKFDTAVTILNAYKNSGIEDTTILKNIDETIITINIAKNMYSHPVNVKLINVGEEINTKRAEYNPFVSADETYLYYTSNKKYISDFQELISGIYMSQGTNGVWGKMKSLGSSINTDESIIIIGVSKDGSTIYSQPESYSFDMNIFYSNQERGRFREVVELNKDINSKGVECGASISNSGDTLYFASNRDGGFGGMDIYFSLKLPNGDWGMPQNAGNEINTKYNENYPEISRDGKRIYFCSDGYNSMGGYDIYFCRLGDDGKWSKPKNLGYPINDTYDNLTISLCGNDRYGYASLTRPEGFGDKDIYKVIFNNIDVQEIIYKGKIACGDSLNPIALKDIDPEISISVFNKDNGDLYGTYSYSHTTGKFIFSLEPGRYEILIEGDSYLPYRKSFEILEGVYAEREYVLNIYLKKK
ncbi:MAG: hypothetical protein A2033_19470 [Bacteroidetes bacterium GWA2_31_9]|nr:MAG: hypothetical protein A2033_19470 [Bacteroidetes bacterium GWA2_31_9]